MRHRQKIIDQYPPHTTLRVMAVSFRCTRHEHALLSRAADRCAKALGAYVRDEVVGLHQHLTARPQAEGTHAHLVEALHVLGLRLTRVHQDLRTAYLNRRPLSDISTVEIYDITQRCRVTLEKVVDAMGCAPLPHQAAAPSADVDSSATILPEVLAASSPDQSTPASSSPSPISPNPPDPPLSPESPPPQSGADVPP